MMINCIDRSDLCQLLDQMLFHQINLIEYVSEMLTKWKYWKIAESAKWFVSALSTMLTEVKLIVTYSRLMLWIELVSQKWVTSSDLITKNLFEVKIKNILKKNRIRTNQDGF